MYLPRCNLPQKEERKRRKKQKRMKKRNPVGSFPSAEAASEAGWSCRNGRRSLRLPHPDSLAAELLETTQLRSPNLRRSPVLVFPSRALIWT